ncbi:MAG: HAMP domain-containing protein [Planctomycetota bacterium]|nr:MAG: HAMP domain-containing protein [Planctomycetota bacterium]
MTFREKLFASFLGVALLICLANWMVLTNLNKILFSFQEVISKTAPTIKSLYEWKLALQKEKILVKELERVYKNPAKRKKLLLQLNEVQSEFARGRVQIEYSLFREKPNLLSQVEKLWNQRYVFILEGRFYEARKLTPPLEKLIQESLDLMKYQLDEKKRKALTIAQRNQWMNLWIIGGLLLVSMALGGWISYLFAQRIHLLERAFQEMGKGNLQYQVPLQGKDEITHLCRQFNEMVQKLREISLSRDYFSSLLETLGSILVVLDRKGKILYGNPSFFKTLNMTPSEGKERNIFDFLVLPLDSSPKKFLENPDQENEVFLCSSKNETIPFLVTLSPFLEDRFILVGQNLSRQKKLETELLEISNREQRRIAQELHDSLGQHLGGMKFMLESLVEKAKRGETPRSEFLEHLAKLMGEALEKARNFTHTLYSLEIQREGLKRGLLELCKNMEKIWNASCHIEWKTDQDLEKNLERDLHLYRIVQEGLNNAFRHGQASEIWIILEKDSHEWRLVVKDNGRSFSLENTTNEGMGLSIMQYRARMIGGYLEIRSHPDHGTTLICHFPL